ncbi:MAG: DUF4493 domain-containing protein, partial [Bacteroidales bacterium]|nr:DUF4493 domain-containing protein [Bacteroidales bacterium]
EDATGTLSTEDMTVDVKNVDQIIESRAASVDISKFIVKVIDKADGVVVDEWTYEDMPGLPVFNVGNYRLEVTSGELVKAGWDTPYFVGTKDFTIDKDRVTKAGNVVCTLNNLKVTVIFEEDLVAASAGDLACEIMTVSSGTEDGSLIFTPEETRDGYFELLPGNSTMVAEFTGTVHGYSEHIIKTYTDIAVGQHRIITFKLKSADIDIPIETGYFDPTRGVNVDFSTIEKDLSGNVQVGDEDVISGQRPGQEEWPDEPVGPVDPTPSEDCISFVSEDESGNELLDLKEGNVNHATDFGDDKKAAEVTIKAEHGIESLIVTINSVGLNEEELKTIGLAKSFDLAHPRDTNEAESLATLGFKVGNEIIGSKSADFVITTFMSMLPLFDGPHEFQIKVVDTQKHEKTLVLTFVNE